MIETALTAWAFIVTYKAFITGGYLIGVVFMTMISTVVVRRRSEYLLSKGYRHDQIGWMYLLSIVFWWISIFYVHKIKPYQMDMSDDDDERPQYDGQDDEDDDEFTIASGTWCG